MTIDKLIAQLEQYDGSRIVVMSKDSEGNDFSPICDISPCTFDDGEVFIEELTEELIEEGYTEDDTRPGAALAIVFYPE